MGITSHISDRPASPPLVESPQVPADTVEDQRSPHQISLVRLKLEIIGEFGLCAFPRLVTVGQPNPEEGVVFWNSGKLHFIPLDPTEDWMPGALLEKIDPSTARIEQILRGDVPSIPMVPDELPTSVKDPRAWCYYEAANTMMWWKAKIQSVMASHCITMTLEDRIASLAPMFKEAAGRFESIKVDVSRDQISDRTFKLASTVYHHDVRIALANLYFLSAYEFGRKPSEWWEQHLTCAGDALNKILVTALAAGYMTISPKFSMPVDAASFAWMAGSEFRTTGPGKADLISEIDLKGGIDSEDVFAVLQLMKNTRKHAPGSATMLVIDEPDARYILVSDLGRGVRDSNGEPMLSPNLTRIFGTYSQDGDKGRGLQLVYAIVRRNRGGAIGVCSTTEEAGSNRVFMSRMSPAVNARARWIMNEKRGEKGTLFMLVLPHKDNLAW